MERGKRTSDEIPGSLIPLTVLAKLRDRSLVKDLRELFDAFEVALFDRYLYYYLIFTIQLLS